MAYISVRKLDSAVIGVNKYATSPDPLALYYEIEKTEFPAFIPHWSEKMWTYSLILDLFTYTGLDMVWY